MRRERSGWVILVAILPITVMNLARVFAHPDAVGQVLMTWRPMVLGLTLVIAGAALVAGLAFGVHAWREAKRHA